jgi:hypothetical protein
VTNVEQARFLARPVVRIDNAHVAVPNWPSEVGVADEAERTAVVEGRVRLRGRAVRIERVLAVIWGLAARCRPIDDALRPLTAGRSA